MNAGAGDTAGRAIDAAIPVQRLSQGIDAPVCISADVAAQVLDLGEIIERIASAYAIPIHPAATPRRTIGRAEGVVMRCLVAVPPGSPVMGAKMFGLGPDRTVQYLIALFDQRSGKVLAFVDAWQITAMRTAATSAVAIDRLTPAGPLSVAVLGSGLEARTHLSALSRIRPISQVRIFSPTATKRGEFARMASEELHLDCRAMDNALETVDGAQLVIAAARAHGEKPTLRAEWLSDDVTVVSIGSTLPEQRELDVSVIDVADIIVCDSIDEVVHETGDMLAATAAGVSFDAKLASLNALVTGEIALRLVTARRRLFKSIGSALQDIVVAELAYNRAMALGLAVPSPISFHTKQV